MKKRTKKILAVAGAVTAGTAAAIGVSYFITRSLVKVALHREQPKAANEKTAAILMGNAVDKDVKEKTLAAAAALRAIPHKTVTITSHDGISLKGHYFEKSKAARTVICMHGWRSSWDNGFGLIAPFFFSQGCNLLIPEQRAHGESGGKYLGFCLLERFDCLDWINFVQKQSKLPIYLAGVSMGATTVLMTAGFKLPKQVKGIIADCGFTSPEEIWRYVIKNNIKLTYHGFRDAAVEDLCKKKISMAPDEYSTETALKECTVPVLFIHGADDHFVPVDMTYKNYLACTGEKTLLIIPGADHALSYYTDMEQYQNKIIEMFNKEK